MSFRLRPAKAVTVLSFIIILGAFGCAKKNKPDGDAMGNVLGKDVIADKDMEFTQ